MKKAVVTGGLGFIGFHLCSRLLENGVETIAVDDKSAAEKNNYEQKIDYFGRNALFTFIEEKIENVPKKTFGKDCHAVFHLAGDQPNETTWSRLHETVESTICRLKSAAEVAEKSGSTFIVASSTDVYGEAAGEISESSKTEPSSALGVVYMAIETFIKDRMKNSGASSVILRMPEVYGPWQPQSGSFHELIVSELKGETLDRESTKPGNDVIYVDDVIEGLILAASFKDKFGLFNIASGKSDEWFKGKQMILGETTGENKREDSGGMFYSITKADKELGFIPKVPVETGIIKQKREIEKNREG
jgi:UDP-glucose 4-epimerase